MMRDGGQAFPNEGFNGWGMPQEGMTLRDYFAAKALRVTCEDFLPEEASVMAYEYADAMLKAREQ
jgi:hypothetical protein